MPSQDVATQLKAELRTLKKPREKPDTCFMRWYLGVRFDPGEGELSIVDGPRDGGIDAIYAPGKGSKRVVFIQSFYADPVRNAAIPLRKLTDFDDLPVCFEDDAWFNDWLSTVREDLKENYRAYYRKISRGRLEPEWLFLTSAKHSAASSKLAAKARRRHRKFLVADRADVLRAYALYVEGAAAPEEPLSFSYMGQPLRYTENDVAMAIYAARIDDILAYVRKDRPQLRLFSRNVRLAIRKSTINTSILETYETEPHEFLLCHNGLTVICARSHAAGGQDSVTLQEPSVVNGAQTLLTLSEAGQQDSGALVPTRVIEVGDYASNARLVRHIALRSNTQNAISPPDLVACDKEQVSLERYFRLKGRVYIRRKGQEVLKMIGPRAGRKVRSVQLATVLACCDRRVGIDAAGRSRNALFEGDFYDRLFVEQTPGEILAKHSLYELLEDARKYIRAEGPRRRSRYAWRNVLAGAWAAVAADRRLRNRIVKQPEELDIGLLEPGARKLRDAGSQAYRFAWDLYQKERQHDDELRPSQYFFGRVQRANLIADKVRHRFGRRIVAGLKQAMGV